MADQLTAEIKIRLTPQQRDALLRLSTRDGLSESTFARQVLHHFLIANDPIYAGLFSQPNVTILKTKADVIEHFEKPSARAAEDPPRSKKRRGYY